MDFEIDGEPYEFPLLSTFDLDEDRIFYRLTGMHTEDAWLGLHDGTVTSRDLFDNEGFLPAMTQVAYRREHPDVDDELIVKVAGRQKRMDMVASLARSLGEPGEEDEPGKDEGTTSVPNESSTSSSSEKPSSSEPKPSPGSTDSASYSEPQEDGPATTGTSGSDTSPASAPVRLVV